MEDHRWLIPLNVSLTEWLNQRVVNEIQSTDNVLASLLGQLESESQMIRSDILFATEQLNHAVQGSGADMTKLEHECVAIRTELESLAIGMNAETTQMIRQLQEVDVIRDRIHKCAETLLEMQNWEQKMLSIEEVFQSRDLKKIAEELCMLKRSLTALEPLPGYDERRAELEEFLSELDTMTTSPLLQALEIRDLDSFRSCIEVYNLIGRTEAVRKHYVESRCNLLSKICSSGPGSELEQISQIYAAISDLLRQECTWCLDSFEYSARSVFEQLLQAFTAEFRQILSNWMTDFAEENKSRALNVISEVLQSTKEYAIEIIDLWRHIRESEPNNETQGLLSTKLLLYSILLPFQVFVNRYAEFEKASFNSFYTRLGQKFGSKYEELINGMSLDQIIQQIDSSSNELLHCLDLSITRMLKMNGGISCQGSLLVLADMVSTFERDIKECLSQVMKLAAVNVDDSKFDPSVPLPPPPKPKLKLTVEGGFEVYRCVINFCVNLREKNADLFKDLETTLNGILHESSRLHLEDNISEERILACFLPRHQRKLEEIELTLLQGSLLPDIDTTLERFRRATENFTFLLLLDNIHRELWGFHRWSCWSSKEKRSVLGLPSYSIQPNDSITTVGDELFTLTQHLELHLEDVDMIVVWLRKLVDGTIRLLLEKIQRIEHLSGYGCKQLIVDIDFILGIIQALGLEVDQYLQVARDIIACDAAEIADLVYSFEEPGVCELAKRLAAIRGVPV